MISIKPRHFIGIVLGVAATVAAQAPQPLPGNPGNVFVAGQEVALQLQAAAGSPYQVTGFDGNKVAQGTISDGPTDLGKLPVGFYVVSAKGGGHPTFVAVVAPLIEPVPKNSPLGVGGGAFFNRDRAYWDTVGSLVALAGVAHEREAVQWQMMQPEKDGGIQRTPPDEKVEVLHDRGLQLLRFVQAIPAWTNHEQQRFPPDLRTVYQFYRRLAERWKGQVQAFEPANEQEVNHTGAELAAYQKAAYLGLKVGNPDVKVGSVAFSYARVPLEMREFADNQAASYFDMLDFHHYQPLEQLPDQYAQWRSIAEGKPLWVTEFNSGMPPIEDPATGNPGMEQMKMQAENLPKTFSAALFIGADAAFYFTMPNWPENGHQFGALQPDLTPRPVYSALAATGRLLAGARIIGQLNLSGGAMAYAFHAVVDGKPQEVIVAWNDHGSGSLRLPAQPSGVFDVIGRQLNQGKNPLALSRSPIFVLLPEGTLTQSGEIKLTPPPGPSPHTARQPSPVVLQAVFSKEEMVESDQKLGPHQVSSSRERLEDSESVQLFAYNFSDRAVEATFACQVAQGSKCSLPQASVTLPPMGRVAVPLQVSLARGDSEGAIQVTASGTGVGTSVLEFHGAR